MSAIIKNYWKFFKREYYKIYVIQKDEKNLLIKLVPTMLYNEKIKKDI